MSIPSYDLNLCCCTTVIISSIPNLSQGEVTCKYTKIIHHMILNSNKRMHEPLFENTISPTYAVSLTSLSNKEPKWPQSMKRQQVRATTVCSRLQMSSAKHNIFTYLIKLNLKHLTFHVAGKNWIFLTVTNDCDKLLPHDAIFSIFMGILEEGGSIVRVSCKT